MYVYLKTLCDILDQTNDECCQIYRCLNLDSKQGRANFDDLVKNLFEAILISYRQVGFRNIKKMEIHSETFARPKKGFQMVVRNVVDEIV